ncbi:DoxX family protein [Nocardia stercoris]|uniref:DoxX family protein n=1 Tax=Nocardia stercoris TaxID=2483361 RepID=A0A3M2LCD8_9NOCA|nr:DoxX family protein [Nocardia stercoris]RMI35209.1 DoxX family protein [Nocardia stercoris]
MTTSSTGRTPITSHSGLDLGLLILRVGFGGLLVVHGTQKLFGWFGGSGLDAAARGFTSMGYHPGKVFATIAGLCEAGGGALLVLGLLTPLAAAIAIGTMINAANAGWHHGFTKGIELPLLFGLAAATLAFTGPGRLAADHGRPWQREGLLWGCAALVLAVVAAVVTLLIKWS